MPTYEYACRDCGEHLEVVQSFKDDALTECPSCKGTLRKVFSAAGLIFKGSGWHIKDYAASSRGSSTSSTSETSTDSGSGKDASPATDASSPAGSKDSKATAGESSAKTAAGSTSSTQKATSGSSVADKKSA